MTQNLEVRILRTEDDLAVSPAIIKTSIFSQKLRSELKKSICGTLPIRR